MKSVEYISKFIMILSKDDDIAKFYSDKLKWAIDRKNNWENDKIRVGVIGVTSSGKSTLINALIGSNVLSSAIAPSSGQLVCCSYGNEYSAVVRFGDDRLEKYLTGKKFTTDNLKEYSDERCNPKNLKNVKSIEILSPNFELEKDVLLIDSPGLDAYGLEIHEKITLETLVPTIDVCIYVTTMKPNSDEKTREILNVVARYGCPLVIVQNMLDAVRPSPSGHKTREEVANDHYSRVKRIVENSDIDNKSNVEIIQISAENARKWKLKQYGIEHSNITKKEYEDSNYEELIVAVNGFLKRQKPEIEVNRISNLHDVISALMSLNEAEISGLVPQNEVTKDYEKLSKVIDSIEMDAKSEFEKAKYNVEKESAKLEKRIESVNEDTVQECMDSVNKLVTSTGEVIHKAIENSNSRVSDVASGLSIPVRDVLKSPSLDFYRDIKIEKKTITTKKSVKDSGIGGFFKRVWGFFTSDDSMGYHTENYTNVVTDIKKTKDKMKNRIAESMSRYASIYDNWYIDTLQRTCDTLRQEILSGIEAEKERKKAIVRHEKFVLLQNEIRPLESEIKAIKIKNVVKKKSVTRNHKEKKYNSVDVDELSAIMIKLARYCNRDQHREIFKKHITSIGASDYHAYIIGWDQDSIDELVWQTGIKDATILNMTLVKNVEIKKRDNCIFIMVNAIQIGAAEKQIRDLQLEKYIKKTDYVFWVIQDFEEIINGNNVEEGLRQLKAFSKTYMEYVRSVIWIVHPNPLYNLTFLQYQEEEKTTLKEESEFLAYLRAEYREYCNDKVIANIGKMIRNQMAR